MNSQNHFAHPKRWLTPRHAETLSDVWLNLTTETEDKATLRISLKIPRGVGQRHRTTRKSDSDRGSDFERGGVFGCHQQRQKRIMAGFSSPCPAIASGFSIFGTANCLVQVGTNSAVNFHNYSPCFLMFGTSRPNDI